MTTDPAINPALRVFSLQDAQNIVAVLENQPTQNLKAARELEALAQRFIVFANTNLNAQAGQKEAKKEAKSK